MTASPRRFDVLGGPGGYLSARYIGAMRSGEYLEDWQRLIRVNVPRRLRGVTPRSVYGAVLAHYRAQGCAV